jgi:hypothetical protein
MRSADAAMISATRKDGGTSGIVKKLQSSITRMVEKHYGYLTPNYVADKIRKNAPTLIFEIEKPATSPDDRRTRSR